MTLHRKIMMLFADGDWKGYLNEIYGNPILVENCNCGIDEIEISGNFLEGDGVGHGSLNLMDESFPLGNILSPSSSNTPDNITYDDGVITFSRNDGSPFYNQSRLLYKITLKSNTPYTMYYKSSIRAYSDRADDINVSPYLRIYKLSTINEYGASTGNWWNYFYCQSSHNLLNFTTDEDTEYAILFNSSIANKVNVLLSWKLQNFMLTEGTYSVDTIPNYVPYNAIRFITLNIDNKEWKCKVPQKLYCRDSLNLFKNHFVDTAANSSMYMNLKPNTSYSLDYVTVASVLYIYDVDSAGTETRLVRHEIGDRIANFTTGKTGKIRVYLTKPSKRENFNSWILLEGKYTSSTMPEYEPCGKISDKVIINPTQRTAKLEINCLINDEGIPTYKQKEIIDISDLQDWDSFPNINSNTSEIFVSTSIPPKNVKYKFYSKAKNELSIVTDDLALRFDGKYDSMSMNKESILWENLIDKSLIGMKNCSWVDCGLFVPTDGYVLGTTYDVGKVYTLDFVFSTGDTIMNNEKISFADMNGKIISDICDYKTNSIFFISVVVNNNNVRLFKDGAFLTSVSITDDVNIIDNDSNVTFNLSIKGNNTWSGIIHAFNVYSTALSDDLIKQNYKSNYKRYGG